MFFDSDAIAVIRHVLLHLLCRNERKRAVMKRDDGSFLCVEPVPEDIAKDQVLVVLTKQITEETLEPMTFESFVFVGEEILMD